MAESCETCRLVERRNRGEAPGWDRIHRTGYWDVAHAFNTSLPGWLVIIARDHVESIADLDTNAAAELGTLIHLVSRAVTHATRCSKTYIMQFAEAPGHGHVHFHVVPRMPDMPETHRGAAVFNYLGVPESDQVSDERMNAVADTVRQFMASQLADKRG